MRFEKLLAAIGLGVSSGLLAAASVKLAANLTLIVGAVLILNPVTQVVGSVIFSTLLLNFAAGRVPSASSGWYLL